MYSAVTQNLIGGLLQPRASARRMLDLGYGMREVMLLILLGYVIGAIFNILLPMVSGYGGAGLLHLFGLLNWSVMVLVMAWLAWIPPRMFGGKGSWEEALRATAWLSVLMNLIWPLMLIAFRILPEGSLLEAIESGDMLALATIVERLTPGDRTFFQILIYTYFFASFWLFASFVAEVHQFRKTWLVFLTMMGLIFGPFLFLGMAG
ncbi:MAG: YIP1 family protein [Pseudomonadota bacterium]